MKTEYEFLSKGEEIFLLTEETKTVSLAEAIGTLAMSTYADLLNLKSVENADEKKELESKIALQSQCLDSMSKALTSLKPFIFR